MRRFLHFSETAAKDAGLTPLQYLLMLHVRGFPNRDWATVNELADRLQMKHHGVVTLLTRCEEIGLVRRQKSTMDRRVVEIHLEEKGAAQLKCLAALHEAELRSLRGTFLVTRITAFNDADPLSQKK